MIATKEGQKKETIPFEYCTIFSAVYVHKNYVLLLHGNHASGASSASGGLNNAADRNSWEAVKKIKKSY